MTTTSDRCNDTEPKLQQVIGGVSPSEIIYISVDPALQQCLQAIRGGAKPEHDPP